MIATPTLAASATPTTNAADAATARLDVTKIGAEMTCGPAIIVIASGRTERFIDRSLPAEPGKVIIRSG